jgi:DNA primase
MYEQGNPIMRYLKGRGFRVFDINGWQLGVVRDPVIPQHEGFEGWISIPYRDGAGRPLGVRLRNPNKGKLRYISPLVPPSIFAVGYCSKVYENLVITEGEFDCITVHKMGMKAVGLPGSASWRREWRWLFRHVDPVIIAVDNDEAGIILRTQIAKNLGDVGIHTRIIKFPEDEDVNSLYVKDRAKLKTILRGAT